MSKIMILSNHFITLYNFRRELIKRLIEEGNEVIISMPNFIENKYFIEMGCKIYNTDVDRRGINPIKDAYQLIRYLVLIKKINPDIILSYTIKPNIYGGIASRITRKKQISNITGTGATFLSDNFINKIAKIMYKFSLKNSYKVLFQNNGDKDFFISQKIVKDNYRVIPGSGVNLSDYQLTPLPSIENEINFIFIGRVMKIKGIEEYLNCALNLKKTYPKANFYIAGFIEESQYSQIINDYHVKGIVQYIGFQKNIKQWIEKCHCTILPSHGGEGVPNALLESAAMGRICVASNIHGSREVIDDNKTGFLFEARNADDLFKKIQMLIELDSSSLAAMGRLAREKMEQQFDRQIIINTYLNEIDEIKKLMKH
ncbi:glycosyltransferase family 4 protein [Paenibacillus oryzae]|uniref:glycosyltransferase family 4 protein n=1 Tax=Paenibacillus oryzae TaxID=1844972 RepID=UPI000B01B9C6|nr:glycosyltransferase family 4 protein [Paenibacillus oryzae]